MIMINKIKRVIILLMILSFTINSYAAISVSDGSAFVTKSEFSADINNLSNRMSQLENSLEAKIDSLVSAYLSRNGIWNGVKQLNTTDGTMSLETVDVSTIATGLLNSQYNLIAKAASGTNLTKQYTIKTDVTKTGMALLQIKANNGLKVVRQLSNGDNYQVSATGQNIDQYIKGAGTTMFNIFKNKNTTVFSLTIGITTPHIYRRNGDYPGYWLSRTASYSNIQFTARFFVDKEDDITYNYMMYNNFYQVGGWGGDTGGSGTLGYKILSFDIY